MTKYKTIKNRFITEFIEKYSDDSNRHFIQVLKKWRDLEKWMNIKYVQNVVKKKSVLEMPGFKILQINHFNVINV